MQISGKMEQYQRSLTEANIPQAKEAAGVPNSSQVLEELLPGRIIEGTILQNKNGQVQLGLSNGEVLQARLQAEMELAVGESLFFQVKSNEGNKIQITPYMQGEQLGNPTLLQALKAANLLVTAQNVEMVDAMMQQQMSIDRQSLGQMARLVTQHPQIQPQNVVQMTKLQLPLTEANAQQFQNYQQGMNHLLSDMEHVQNDLMKILSNETMRASGAVGNQELISINQTVAQILSEGAESMLAQQEAGETKQIVQEDSVNGTVVPTATAKGMGQAAQSMGMEETNPLLQQDIAKETAQGIATQTQENQEDSAKMLLQSTAEESGGKMSVQSIAKESDREMSPQSPINENGKGISQQSAVENVELEMPSQTVMQKENSESLQQNRTSTNGKEMLSQGRAGENTSEMLQSATAKKSSEMPLQSLGEKSGKETVPQEVTQAATAEQTDKMEHGNHRETAQNMQSARASDKTPQDFLKQAQSLVQRLPGQPAQEQAKQVRNFFAELSKVLSEQSEAGEQKEWKQLFGNKAYQKLVRHSFELQWTMSPEQVAEKTKVSELYQRLQNQLHRLEQAFQSAAKQVEIPRTSVTNMEQNLEFMNQMNHIFQYVQLPLKLAGENAHADLYVYTNKKEKRGENEELSAFLHLDLNQLGETDISVKMLRKDVRVEFFLSSPSACKLMQSHSDDLREMLEQIGYRCTVQLQEKKKNVDLAENFLRAQGTRKTGRLHRYSFDATV